MKKLMFTVVALLLLLPCFVQASEDSKSKRKAEIIEKGTTRYFKLGDQEYVCNSDNRISDDSAKLILKTVRKIYSATNVEKKVKEENDKIIDAIWYTFHQVYVGEIYDQIMFECLKYKLNELFQFVTAPKINKNKKDMTILISGIAHVSMGYNEGVSKSTRGRLSVSYWYRKSGGVTFHGMGATQNMGSVGGSTKKFTEAYSHGPYDGRERAVSAGRRLSGSREEVQRLYEAAIKKIQTKTAGDNFVGEFELLLSHFAEKSDLDSFVYDSEWDQTIVASSRYVLKFRDNFLKGKYKSDFDKDSLNLFATKMMNSCLKFCKNDETKKELVDIANKNNIKITAPKIEKPKTLF